jgi:hypothetical protein
VADGLLPGDSNNPTTGSGAITAETALKVTQTQIPVRFDASLTIGDDLVAFGTGNFTGVGYVIPSTIPAEATAVPGDYRNAGFAVAGKKLLLFDDEFQLSIYDTTAKTTVPIALAEVFLAPLPGREGLEELSPVVADGLLAITLSRAGEVTDGRMLKLLDVSGTTPVVTPLQNPSVNIAQVAISNQDRVVIAHGGDQFFIYDINDPNAAPRAIDLANQGGILGPFVYGSGHILYVAKDSLLNIRLLNVNTAVATALVLNPGNRDLTLALRGGRYAYFLERNAYDTVSSVYRAAVGTPTTTPFEGGIAGDDPRDNVDPWAGYGGDIAITPNGNWVFISGDEALDATAEYIQVSTAGTAFKAFADGKSFLSGSDVEATDRLVAFKIGAGENTRLAYIQLP